MPLFFFYCHTFPGACHIQVPNDVDVIGLIDAIYEKYFSKLTISLGQLRLFVLPPGLTAEPLDTLDTRVQHAVCDKARLSCMGARRDIADLFPNHGMQDLHFVVRISEPNTQEQSTSSLRAEKDHLKAVNNARAAPSPSSISKAPEDFKKEQVYRPIYNGRDGRIGPAITVYNRAFAELKDDLADLNAITFTPKELESNAALFAAAATVYHDEDKRLDAMYDPLASALRLGPSELRIKVSLVESRVITADAMAYVAVNNRDEPRVFVYVSFKNEIGNSGDASLQVALTYREHVSQDAYAGVRNASCCPCILIAIAGPWIHIFGAIFVDIPIVQPFTEYIQLMRDPLERGPVEKVTRIFHAVAKAVAALKSQYTKLEPTTELIHDRLFPASSFVKPTAEEEEKLAALRFEGKLDYEGRGSDDHGQAIFRGKLHGRDVVIKFCETYGVEAHKLLADENPALAPTLHLAVKVRGGLLMVVMDLVNGQDAFHHFCEVHVSTASARRPQVTELPLPEKVKQEVKKAVELLHERGFVFGDLRRPNIIVVHRFGEGAGKGDGAMLVDFDWAGTADQAAYPAFINKSGDIEWADGVGPGCLITKEHDMFMLERL